MSAPYAHQPVLVHEVLEAFSGDRPRLIIDGTLGLGGHTEQLLEKNTALRVMGLDWDANALTIARRRLERFGSRFEAVQSSYADLPKVLAEKNMSTVDGLLVDLGLSSLQLADTARGFSFNSKGPLDMRMSDQLPYTAWDFIVQNDERALERIFKEYGEEKFGRRAAIAIKDALRSGELKNDAESVANVFRKAIPTRFGSIDAATRSFQALRIAVNGELDNVRAILAALPNLLATGGRAVIIAFHSLEDRLVKRAFQQAARGCVCPPRLPQCVCGQMPWGKMITRKALRATESEIADNPRARSAVLRILEKL